MFGDTLPPGLPPKVAAAYRRFIIATREANLADKKAILARGASMTQQDWVRLKEIIADEKRNRI